MPMQRIRGKDYIPPLCPGCRHPMDWMFDQGDDGDDEPFDEHPQLWETIQWECQDKNCPLGPKPTGRYIGKE